MKGSAGGQHFIDHQNRPSLKARNCGWRHGKGAGDIALSLMPAQPASASRRPPPDQHVRGENTLRGVMAQMTRSFRRLIVVSSEIAPPMKRYRDDQRLWAAKFNEKPRAKSGQKRRQLQPVAMLVMQDQLARAVRMVETGPDGGQWAASSSNRRIAGRQACGQAAGRSARRAARQSVSARPSMWRTGPSCRQIAGAGRIDAAATGLPAAPRRR